MTASLVTQQLKRLARYLWRPRFFEVLIGLGALGAAAAVLALGGDETSSAPRRHGEPRRITVAAVERAPVLRTQRYAGVLQAAERAHLGFTLGGRIAARPVELGQRVKKGAVLARLDPAPFHNALAAALAARRDARVRLGQAERDQRRTRSLVQARVLPTAQLEQLDAGVESLRALVRGADVRVAEAARTLREATLRAPFDGEVTEVRIRPGELVAPGVPLFLLSGGAGIEVRVELPEALAADLRRGQPVTVDLPLVGRRGLAAKVRDVGRTAAGAGRLFPVLVSLAPAEGLRAGMTAEVVLTARGGLALSVPVAAVVNPSGRQPAVYQVRDRRVRRVPVTVAALVGGRVALRGDLEPGGLVAVSGHADLLDGDLVRVVPGKARGLAANPPQTGPAGASTSRGSALSTRAAAPRGARP